jgi:hypothetical protein
VAKINAIDITSLMFQEGSAPSTPASTKWKLYFKSTGLYIIDDAGAETLVASASVALLFDSTLGGTATSIDTSTVLAGYKHLKVEFQGRSDRAGQVFEGVDIQFNGDTGSNYDSISNDFNNSTSVIGSSESIGATAGLLGSITGATGVANVAGAFTAEIQNYGSTTFHKNYNSFGGVKYANSTTNVHNYLHSGVWRSTAAITRIVVKTRNASNFIAGTRLTVYGIA